MRVSWFVLAALLVVLGIGHALHADVITLDDGTTLEGSVKRVGDAWVVTDAKGIQTKLKPEQVKSIEVKSNSSPSSVAARLDSLRRSVTSLNDIPAILDRYKRFIDQNPTVADEAAKDVAIWQDRMSRGFVKFGGKWVAPDERAQLQGKSMLEASQARDLIKQNRLREADPLLREALADDPDNATALYLRALVQADQNQLGPAKTSLEATDRVNPGHGPTLNNLAVVLYRLRQYGPAMNVWDLAMQASPNDKMILDNVAEAFFAMPDDSRQGAPAKKAASRFAAQDLVLQKQQSQQGWYRWGATWVNGDQIQMLKAAEAQVQAQIDDLSSKYDSASARIQSILSEINDNVRTMHRMEAQNLGTDINGNPIRLPLPSEYYQLDRDNRQLDQERQDQLSKQQQYRDQARKLQQSFPVPKYTGVPRLIGVEGTPTPAFASPAAVVMTPTTPPAAAVDAPTTEPATQPTLKLQDILVNPGG